MDGVTFFQLVKTLSSSFIVCSSLNCVSLLWSLGSCLRTNSNQNEEPTKGLREEANLKYDLNETKPTQKRRWEHGGKRTGGR